MERTVLSVTPVAEEKSNGRATIWPAAHPRRYVNWWVAEKNMERKETVPKWVHWGLLGIRKRKTALVYLWASLILCFVVVPGSIVIGEYTYCTIVFVPLWYWLSIKWVDKNGSWEALARMKINQKPKEGKMKEVTIKYNIGITFALIAYVATVSPFMESDPPKTFIDGLLASKPLLALLVAALSIIVSTVVSMFIIRSLWNRLVIKLSGWKEINLAESYALLLFFAIFFIA